MLPLRKKTVTKEAVFGKVGQQHMPPSDFTISLKPDSVEIQLTPSANSPYAKLGGAIFIVSILIAGLCALLFLPGKHSRPNMWHDMSNASIGSSDLLVPLTLMILFVVFMAWLGFRWSAAAWPSDETLHCDHTALTISRIPYLDFLSRTWKTKTYTLRDIQKFRFAVYASAKGSSIYGFRFRANGRRHKTLPGLEAPEAQNILTALQRFGVDVILDDKLQKKIDEALKKRGNQLSLGV
jgi:hypothetical protein